MSLRYKLLLGFILVTLLTLPVSLYTISATNQIKNNFTDIVDYSFPRLQALLEMQMATRRVTSFINNFNNEIAMMSSNENTPTKIGATKDQMLAYLGEIEEWQRVYKEKISYGKKSLLNLNELTRLRDIVVLSALDNFNAKEKNLSQEKQILLRKSLDIAQNNLERFIKFSIITETDFLNKEKKEAIQGTQKIFWITLLLNMLIILIAVIISFILTILITRPIIKLKNFSGSITQENLNNRFPIITNDEIGELAKSINSMLENLLQAKTQLIATSRTAGIAEIATSILHNVGNVLNSINVSAAMMLEVVRNSKSVELKKINELLDQHKDNVSEYLESDERGKLIIPYLIALSKELAIENNTVKTELTRLATNLEHVNNIIAMQQPYGRSKGLVEPILLAELINTTCMISENRIRQLGIELNRDFEEILPISSVKAKLQQILINLIKNSIEAVADNSVTDKKIIIRLKKNNNKVQVFIIDNGRGIEEKNLTKIFTFGFTTKSNGHGYGLHNSALLAKELGGKLTVSSEGLGKGATFILEIPC